MSQTTRQEIDSILDGFAARIELDGFALDADGNAQLAFDDVLVHLQLDEADDRLLMLAPLGTPGADAADTYRQLLDANFFWSETNGATAARDPASGAVVLMQGVQVTGLGADQFEAALQGFVNAAEALTKRLAAAEDQEASEAAAATPFTGGPMIRG
jgi:hypothetical protein